ncbi:penicillin acylase family protein [Thalassobacillus hwangdonensis]|uniref:Penicillin acylase family protein n=1 Tax=Thalassobacillus hwangdonensis TaxID=546108 RepID=A0ABW3KXB5_9BACI
MEAAKQLQQDHRPGMKRWKKALIITSIIVVVLIASVITVAVVYVNRSLPNVEGEANIPGLEDPVEVIRDDTGVPHIKAESLHDLFLAQGYVQAQDRMFQMELARRQASGTLSEVVGEATVEQDKYFRTLGLRRAAEKSLSIYSDEAVEVLEAYAEGVNTYIEQTEAENRWPPEFLLMGIKPEPWTPVDSLTIGKYMAFDLGGHWERQAFNYYLLNTFTEEKAYELFPSYPDKAPSIINETEVVDIASSFKGAVMPDPFNGSNNWVVSGNKTKSGKPLLADDPHLGLASPSIWYQMELEAPDYQVSGVIFAGIPGIILGHNDSIAWGVTNVGPDVQQLYLEKRNPENPTQFMYEGEWVDAQVHDEPIAVKDSEPIDYQVTETRHGPIVSEFSVESDSDMLMSLRWTALDSTTELEAVLEINQAENWEEFETGLEKFLAPAQNFVYADIDGNIGYKANGKIPIYENGDDALLPLRGWEEEDEWKGFIPFDELPQVFNPEKGYIATANNQVAGDSYPYHLSNNWAQPYRYQRIAEMLEQKDGLTSEDMKNMQLDTLNLQAREFLPFLLEQLDQEKLDEKGREVVSQLKAWNFEDKAELAQPLVFHRWLYNLEEEIYGEQIPEEVMEFFHGSGQTTDELLRSYQGGQDSIWVEEAGGISSVIHESFTQTVEDLNEELGGEPDSWKWGDWHQVQFRHPLSSISYLEPFYNGKEPLPVDGSRVTVRAVGYNKETGKVTHGAPWRFVVDADDFSKAEHIVAPGQSGHFRSEWYDNQVDDWVEGNYHTTSVGEQDGNRLMLLP